MPHLNARRRRALLGWAATDTALGMVLMLSPAARVSSGAFDSAKSIAPMHVWGLIAFLFGACWFLVGLAARRIPWPLIGYLTGLLAAVLAGWHAFFWMSLCFAAAAHPTVGLTGCVIYAGVAFNHVLFAADQV